MRDNRKLKMACFQNFQRPVPRMTFLLQEEKSQFHLASHEFGQEDRHNNDPPVASLSMPEEPCRSLERICCCTT